MALPFSADEFFRALRQYNEAVWPAQWILGVLAIVAVVLLWKAHAPGFVLGILAFFWAWMALVYHLVFFDPINRAAFLFAVAFVVQAALLDRARRTTLAIHRSRLSAIVGGALIAYALIGYPALGYVFGHRYPANPTFGLPCPTVIFTLGALTAMGRTFPRRLLVIPALWAVVATSAAIGSP
jgi:hypothetical protein